ncbi:MAG: glycosyltransferase, partial [Candidatus Binataceae bacterium]
MNDVLAVICAALWVYLICGRSLFWMAGARDEGRSLAPATWPPVMIVVPARNEADMIGASVRS